MEINVLISFFLSGKQSCYSGRKSLAKHR